MLLVLWKEIWHLTTEAETKWPPLWKQHFQTHFPHNHFEKKHWGLFLNSTLIIAQASSGPVTWSVPSQCLDWWWLSSLTHTCITYTSPSHNAIYIIYQVVYLWIWYYVVKTNLVYPHDLLTHDMGEMHHYHTKIKHQRIMSGVPILHGVVYILFICTRYGKLVHIVR